MLPFRVELKAGLPIADQVIFAVKKAVVGGQLPAGAPFPSVRTLSQELKINPNTAHRIISLLVQERVLVATPAKGTTVAESSLGSRAEKAELLTAELERLVVEASKLGLSLEEVQRGLERQWKNLHR